MFSSFLLKFLNYFDSEIFVYLIFCSNGNSNDIPFIHIIHFILKHFYFKTFYVLSYTYSLQFFTRALKRM